MGDSYQARCPQNSVIMMTSSVYGRINVGKCISSGQSNMGCQTDVLTKMDTICSGNRECVVERLVSKLVEFNPCPAGTTPFLKVSYSCAKGTCFSMLFAVGFEWFPSHRLN